MIRKKLIDIGANLTGIIGCLLCVSFNSNLFYFATNRSHVSRYLQW